MADVDSYITTFLEEQKKILENERTRLLGGPKVVPYEVVQQETEKNCEPIESNNAEELKKHEPILNKVQDWEMLKDEDPFVMYDNVNTLTKPKQNDNVQQFRSRSTNKNEMEQWVSDTFYQYFPSLNKDENEKKSKQSRARQLEYQEYLKNVNHIANVIPEVLTKRELHMRKYGNQNNENVDDNNNNSNNNDDNNNVNDMIKKTSTESKKKSSKQSLQEKQDDDNSSHKLTLSPKNLKPTLEYTENRVDSPIPAAVKNSPRHRHLEDMKHIDLPTILNTDLIAQRNRLLAEEEARRKMDYQKELIQQIQDKRKEVERLRDKERMEEEMLTRRLEQQLKTMELEEELEREKKMTEKLRVTNEQNHIRRLQLLSNLENDHKLYNPVFGGERKTQSESGKDAYEKKEKVDPKEKAYRYFSTSARKDNEKLTRFATPSISSTSFDDTASECGVPAPNVVAESRYQYCKGCRSDINQTYFTPGKYTKKPKKVETCISCRIKAEDFCRRCRNDSKRPNLKNLCVYCERSLDPKATTTTTTLANRTKSIEHLDRSESPPRAIYRTKSFETIPSPPPSPPGMLSKEIRSKDPHHSKVIDIQYIESDNDQDITVLNPVIVKNTKRKPYSMNVEKDSLFHPSKKPVKSDVAVNIRNGEIFVNKLKSRDTEYEDDEDHDEDEANDTNDDTDERITKYAQHYDTLWMKRNSKIPKSTNHRLASLSPPKIYVSNRPDNLKSDALKTMEKKWDIPAVRRTKISDDTPRVLTQLGAIRKQLQLEQMDQTYTKMF